jgi:thiol-disulfide isomerase/thioredoxin
MMNDMAFTASKMLPLGTIAPDFDLPDTVSGKNMRFADIAGANGTVVMFLCNHCPYVIHVNEGIVQLAKDYWAKGVGFVGISSNDADKYPQDAPPKMTLHAQAVGYPFPYLYDENQQVALDYDAACTPDFYLFDGKQQLVYRGRLDKSRPNSGLPVTGEDLRKAIDQILLGEMPHERQYPSGGCNIKWKVI